MRHFPQQFAPQRHFDSELAWIEHLVHHHIDTASTPSESAILIAVLAICLRLYPGIVGSTAWPLQHPIVATVTWSAALLVIFVPLAVWRYQRAGR